MALYERLLGYTAAGAPLPEGVRKIPQHTFPAALAERARGQLTNAQVIAALDVTVDEQADLLALIARFTTGGSRLTREEFEDAMYLAAQRLPPYDSIAAFRSRIGV